MIFKYENLKVKEMKGFYAGKDKKHATVKTISYWFLFIPVFTKEEIIDLRSD